MNKRIIKRQRYLDKVAPFIDKAVIKVLVGQRRVGKSYLLLQIMDELVKQGIKRKNIVYINKEMHEFDQIANYADLLSFIRKQTAGRGKKYLFLDEIQEIDRFEKALSSLQAKGGYDIYCTGSNADLLSGELASRLSGRYIEIKVYGLSFLEFLDFHGLANGDDAFEKYVKYGGLPYLVNLRLDDEVVYDYLRSIYNTILFKDVVARYHVRNVAFLENLVEYLADNTGSLVSAKKISDFLKSQKIKISPNVVLNYLAHLTAAFFVFRVPRSGIIGKKIFEIGEKYYFEDLGLRHTLIGYKQPDINKVLENLVFLHLKILGYDVTVGKLGDREVDFVCAKGGERLYVQVAYLITDQKTRDREFGNLLQIEDNYPKVVVSMDKLVGANYKGIEQVNIRDFLSRDWGS